MSSRGTYGFYKNGINKLTYNAFDSYPESLGEDMVRFIKACSVDELNHIFDSLILIDERLSPTDKQIKECMPWYDSSVSSGSLHDWYCLLRRAQGNPMAYRDGLHYMLENNTFIRKSLYCAWGYVVNLDSNILEIYNGDQKEPNGNRYVCEPEGEYYNCKLIKEYPLGNIPDDWIHDVCISDP